MLGERIQQLRLALGLTQRDLAGMRYSAAYVSSVESGRRTPSSDALRHFADRLGVSEEELLSGHPAGALDLAFVQALATGTGMQSVADTASGRLRAWALIALDSPLDEPAHLLTAESPVDRIPLVLAEAAKAEPRYAVYLLARARDELYWTGHPDPDALFALQATLAAFYLEVGADDRAAAAAAEALELAWPGDPERVGAGFLATAKSLLAARRTADATVAIGQARAAYRRREIRPALAACHRARGRQRRLAGDLAGAVGDLVRARELYGDSELSLDVGVELAEIHRRQGQTEIAETLLTEALGADSSELRTARASHERAMIALDRGDTERAEQDLRNALALFERHGPRKDLARCLYALGDLLYTRDRLTEAAELLHIGLLHLERP